MLVFEYKVPCILVEFSKFSKLCTRDIWYLSGNRYWDQLHGFPYPKQSPIILNHKIVCSEQNVFLKNESSNTVLMKGSTKTAWKINQSKLMETLEISVFIIHVKFCSWFNLEGNFYSKMHFSLLYFSMLLFFSFAWGLRLLCYWFI